MNLNESETDTQELLPKVRLKDRLNLVYLIIFCTGMGTLIPWNYFITAKQYFIFKLDPGNNDTKSDFRPLFENYLSLFSMVPMAITNMLNLYLRRYITPMKRFNYGVSLLFMIFTLTLILTKINIDWFAFFWITMTSVAILNVCSGLIQGSTMGIVSMMPSRYIKAAMEGQALSGILASISNIISISVASNPDQSAFIYFFLALIVLVFSAIGFCSLGKIRFSKEFVQRSMNLNSHIVTTNSDDDSVLISQISFTQQYLPLFRRIFWHALSVVNTFLITLSVFPAFSSSIISYSDNRSWRDIYFTPVTSFLFFNLGDYIGRFLCGYIKIPAKHHPKRLFMMTLLRWILVPLIFLCNIQHKKYFPTPLTADVYPIILIWVLGISNGYLLTLSFVYAPCFVNDNEKEAVGTLMSLFLCLGLSLGVSVSLLFNYIIII